MVRKVRPGTVVSRSVIVGVGVGEAGSSPPSHSIIADLYPPEKRAGAMAIYSTGGVLGGGFGTQNSGRRGPPAGCSAVWYWPAAVRKPWQ